MRFPSRITLKRLRFPAYCPFSRFAPKNNNLLKGGFANGHHQDSKDKMSKSHTGKIVTEITKARMSKARMGELNPNYGKVSCRALRTAKYTLSGDFIEEYISIKEAAKSITKDALDTIEMVNKCSSIWQACREDRQRYGYLWMLCENNERFPSMISPVKEKIYKTRSVSALNPSGEYFEFDSIKIASDQVGCATPNILRCILGESKHTKGWTDWQYLTDKERSLYVARKNDIDTSFKSLRDANEGNEDWRKNDSEMY